MITWLKKSLALIWAWATALLAGVSATYADVYTMPAGTLSWVSQASADTTTSTFTMLGQILPVMVPLIVLWFGISLVMGFIHKRG